jgi:hypothetical protein
VLCTSDCSGLGGDHVLASGQEAPAAVAVYGTNVYWVNGGEEGGDGQVLECGVGGCDNTPTTLAMNQNDPLAVAVDSSSVYWVNADGTVMKCGLSGCGSDPMMLDAAPGGECDSAAMAIDADSVYWTCVSSVLQCPLAGCPGGTPTVLADNLDSATAITIDAHNVYFTTQSKVMQCAIGGCGDQPTTLAIEPGLGGVAVDAENVYFTSTSVNGKGQVMKCAIGGCELNPTVVVNGLFEPTAIVASGTNLFWTDAPGYGPDGMAGEGDLSTCPSAGCDSPTVLASSLYGPIAIAVDQANVYFTEQPGDFGEVEWVPQ